MSILSNEDIKREIENNNIFIIPFDESNIKGASYDISPTMIAISTRCGMLEKVYRDKKYPFNYYIYVRAKDTVHIISKEYLSVPNFAAGYVISRVSNVVKGIGHVSTSIDPGWNGAGLIALSNPTNKNIKIYVGGENPSIDAYPLATVTFHYLNSPSNINTNYSGMRLDLLRKINYLNRTGAKAFFQRMFHPYRKEFTDFFFKYCQTYSGKMEDWLKFSSEFTGGCKEKNDKRSRQKTCLKDFVLHESKFNKFWSWIISHFEIFSRTFVTIVTFLIVLLIVLEIFGVVPHWCLVILQFLINLVK